MIVLGILVFLSGILLVVGEALARSSRNRQEQKSWERNREDLASRLAILESSYPQALVRMDSLGLIRRINGAAERLFGYQEAELLGQSILRLLPFVPSPLDPNAARSVQLEVRCKDRSTVIVRMTGTHSGSEGRADIYMFFESAVAEELSDLDQSQSHGAAAGI